MARKKKEPDAPLTETQVRAKRAIVDDKVTNEIIRDAFLEGRDELAASMLRQRDGQHHAKLAAKIIKTGEERMRNLPPTCFGGIAALRDIAVNVGKADCHLDTLPHEMRAPNSKLFGRRNVLAKKLQEAMQVLQNACEGRPQLPTAGPQIPYGDVPLEGSKKRRRRR